MWIGGIDPIEKGLLIPKDQGSPIEHDLGRVKNSISCRTPVVFVNQPAQDISPLDGGGRSLRGTRRVSNPI